MVTVVNGVAEFSFFRPNVKSVFISGDFNDWRTDQLSMTRGQNGYWHAKIPLPAGDFKFRYYSEGVWYTDFAAFGIEPGDNGFDSMLHVDPRRLMVEPAPVQPAVAAA